MIDTEVKNNDCPFCGKALNRAMSTFGDYVPKPNDITICIGCASPLVYTEDMSLVEMAKEEIEKLDTETQCKLRIAQGSVAGMHLSKVHKMKVR